MSPRRILITGGAGFIGSHLAASLAGDACTVRILDLRAPAREVPGVTYLRGDVRRRTDVDEAIRNVDAVYHLAAISSVPACNEVPYESTATNLASTSLILERLPSAARFIFASSAAVYGDSGREGAPLSEQAHVASLASLYAVQKYASELLIQQFHNLRQVEAVVFRFFNVYGPGQDPRSPYSGVITAFAEALRTGASLRLNGGGSQTRDFVSVHDVVRALVMALDFPAVRCDGMPINLGSGRPCQVRELACVMSKMAGTDAAVEATPWRVGDIRYSLADIARAERDFGWRPRVELAEGLRELHCPMDETPRADAMPISA